MSSVTVSSSVITANNTLFPDGTLARRETKNGKYALTVQSEKPVTYWIAFPAKLNCNFTGIFPFVIQDIFLDFVDVETMKGEGERAFTPFRASVFKGVSSETSENINEYIAEMIKTKQLAAFHFASGILKEVWVHEDLADKMEANAISEITLDNGAVYSQIKEDFDITPISDEVYPSIMMKLLYRV